MYFHLLQGRLVARLKRRIQNGDFTERRLALLTGVSQPHIHNVLKGARIFSPEIGDRILRKLQMSLLDLFDKEELEGLVVSGGDRRYREVPVLEGRLGPGLPLPGKLSRSERYPHAISGEAPLVHPVFARLAGDERMAGIIRKDDLVLLDQSPAKRTDLEPEALYVVSRNGEGVIRWACQGERCLFLLTEETRRRPERWERLSLAGCHLLDILKAKVVWIGRMLE
jgi:transcriptional regulator with XRE-family HTH domain